jgi:6-phosphogluconolactonase
MIEAEWWEYDSLDELADAVAGDVGFIIESAVDARGASLIAVPGGRTGPAIFPKLAAQKQQWKRVTIIPTDDRLVPMKSDLANVREIARAFLPLGARVVPIATEITDYRLAGNSADARLQDLPWPIIGGIVGGAGGAAAWLALGVDYAQGASLLPPLVLGLLGGTAVLWLVEGVSALIAKRPSAAAK